MSSAAARSFRPRNSAKGKKQSSNPLQAGIRDFLISTSLASPLILLDLPKRYTIYSPLLLLPLNFSEHGAHWHDLYAGLDASQKSDLFKSVAEAFERSGQHVTHIAINAPIPPSKPLLEFCARRENVIRSPSNLLPIHGDFGPSSLSDADASIPSSLDFDSAFWVSTRQNETISQVWSPRWTMFSRGNLTEKTRILHGRNDPTRFPGLTDDQLGCPLNDTEVVDMFVGIGYFAFSYLANGVKRVWGWDLNPWSIEGLRRGCQTNGWRCLVLRVDDEGCLVDTSVGQLAKLLVDVPGQGNTPPVRCVAFHGDNRWAMEIMAGVRSAMQDERVTILDLSVRHVNLGLLPTSRLGWDAGSALVDSNLGGWLHVHENGDMHQIKIRSQEIVLEMLSLLAKQKRGDWEAECVHVEEVKTYAPGVMHCVFDIHLRPPVHP